MFETFSNGLWADRYLIAGVLAAIVSAAAFWPYIYHTVHGTTRPDRACWLIWAVLAGISGASNIYEGASTSLVFVGVQVLGTFLVFGLSIARGSGHLMSRTNVLVLSVATVGLVSWVTSETSSYALAISISVSALGGLTTIWKAYHAPSSEALSAWCVLLLAAVLGVYSVGSLDPLLLAYPLYLAVLYGAIVVAQGAGQMAQAEREEEAARASRRMRVPPITARAAPMIAPRPELARAAA